MLSVCAGQTFSRLPKVKLSICVMIKFLCSGYLLLLNFYEEYISTQSAQGDCSLDAEN